MELQGSATITVTIQGRWALSLLTSGWTDEEKEGLLRRTDDSLGALEDSLLTPTLDNPDELDVDEVTLEISRVVDSEPNVQQVTRYSWTQPCCESCWWGRNPRSAPVRVPEDLQRTEECVYCGLHTDSGIYIRIDPEEARYPSLDWTEGD